MVLGLSGFMQVETKTSFQAPGDDSNDICVKPSKETLIVKPVHLHLSGQHDVFKLGCFPSLQSWQVTIFFEISYFAKWFHLLITDIPGVSKPEVLGLGWCDSSDMFAMVQPERSCWWGPSVAEKKVKFSSVKQVNLHQKGIPLSS